VQPDRKTAAKITDTVERNNTFFMAALYPRENSKEILSSVLAVAANEVTLTALRFESAGSAETMESGSRCTLSANLLTFVVFTK
jgi:hypothetical protein